MNDKEKKSTKKRAPRAKGAAAAGAGKARKKTVAAAGKTAAAPPKQGKAEITPEQHFRLVQEAAYYIAEKDGFASDPCRYWLEAEDKVAKGAG